MNVKQDVLSLTSIHWAISVAASKYPHFCLTGKVTQALGSALERFWAFLERNDKRNTFPMATHSYSCTLTKGGLIWVFLSGEIPATRDVTVALCLFTADFPTDSSGTRNYPPFSLLLWSNLKLCGFQTENYFNGRNQSSPYWGYDSELVRCT